MVRTACRRVLVSGAVLLAMLALARAGHAQSAESPETLARRLATLRAEVEELSEQLSQVKTDSRNEVQALARQKSDLKVELDREQVRLSKLRESLGSKREKIEQTAGEGKDLEPVFVAAVAGFRKYISQSLPFRRPERLAEVAKIEDQRKSGLLTYPRALARLWSLAEDELRITHESAAHQQTIELDGEEQLADVVRVGMVMMYFQTSDGVVGYTQKTPQGWKYFRAEDSGQRKQVRELFDSFNKQIRVGFFHLPNALPQGTK
jgi:TolA-binding protein